MGRRWTGGGGTTVQHGPPIVFDRRTMKIKFQETAVDQLRRLKMMYECGLQHAAAAGGDGSRTHCVRKTAAPI